MTGRRQRDYLGRLSTRARNGLASIFPYSDEIPITAEEVSLLRICDLARIRGVGKKTACEIVTKTMGYLMEPPPAAGHAKD